MKKIGLLLLVCIFIFSSLSVFAGGAKEQKQEKVLLRLGLTAAEDVPETISARKFGELLTSISGGAMTAEVLAAGLAGGERDIVEGQQLGSLQMSVVSGILQNFDKAMMILEYDLLFKNQEHVKKVFNGPIGETINKRLIEKAGIRVLGVYQRTPRLLTTRRPVKSLQDLKGLKIRVPEMAARVELWKALGANPTPLSFPEVFTGLQTGTIDGQENPIGLIYGAKLFEVAPYLAITNHLYGYMFITISEKSYQGLSSQQKAWVEQAAAESVKFNDNLALNSEKDYLDKVKPHVTTTVIDVTSWREQTKDVYKKFANVEGFTELYNAIVEAGKGL